MSSYNAAQVTFTHRWSHGLHFIASYTVSKALDNAEGWTAWTQWAGTQLKDYNNLAAEKSLSSNDIPQSLVLSYICELPVGRGKHWGSSLAGPVNAVLGGWQVSGVSTFKKGFPLSILAGNNNTNSYGGAQRPNIVGDPHLSNPTINEWFNTSAFALPPAYTFGDAPRFMPNLRAPGLNNWDVGIQKWWALPQERLRVQFRAEMFNAFNHPNFYQPDQTFGSPTFGRISGALPARSVQLGLKVYW